MKAIFDALRALINPNKQRNPNPLSFLHPELAQACREFCLRNRGHASQLVDLKADKRPASSVGKTRWETLQWTTAMLLNQVVRKHVLTSDAGFQAVLDVPDYGGWLRDSLLSNLHAHIQTGLDYARQDFALALQSLEAADTKLTLSVLFSHRLSSLSASRTLCLEVSPTWTLRSASTLQVYAIKVLTEACRPETWPEFSPELQNAAHALHADAALLKFVGTLPERQRAHLLNRWPDLQMQYRHHHGAAV